MAPTLHFPFKPLDFSRAEDLFNAGLVDQYVVMPRRVRPLAGEWHGDSIFPDNKGRPPRSSAAPWK
jgi:hypothetical protein